MNSKGPGATDRDDWAYKAYEEISRQRQAELKKYSDGSYESGYQDSLLDIALPKNEAGRSLENSEFRIYTGTDPDPDFDDIKWSHKVNGEIVAEGVGVDSMEAYTRKPRRENDEWLL